MIDIQTLTSLALAISRSFELSVAVKATGILVLATVFVFALGRARASRRHVVLALSFVALLLLPVAARFARPVNVYVATMTAHPVDVRTFAASPASDNGVARSDVTPRPSTQERPAWAIASPLRALWMSGTGLLLIPVVVTIFRLRRLRASADPWPHGAAVAIPLTMSLGINRRVGIFRHPHVTAPFTFGTMAPVVMLPLDAATWQREDLARALVHELEHIRRRDWTVQLMARITCALYWWHPLVWIAWRRLHVEADRACDDAVVAGGHAHAFARQLVAMAQQLSDRRSAMTPAMASRGGLSARVTALLDTRQSRGRAGSWWAIMTTTAAVACGVALSTLQANVRVEPGVSSVASDIALTVTTGAPDPAPLAAVRRHQIEDVPVKANGDAAPPDVSALVAIASGPRPEAASQALSPSQVSPDATSLRFETVTLRRSRDSRAAIPSPSANSFIAYGVTVEALLTWAHGFGGTNVWRNSVRPHAVLDDSPVRGNPAMSDRFDIMAKAPFETDEPRAGNLGAMHYMVQALLAERFGLVTRWETRQRAVYVLHKVSGGQLGSRIRPSELGCGASAVSAVAVVQPPPPGAVPFRSRCGFSASTGGLDSPFLPSRLVTSIQAGGVTMADLIQILTSALRAEVVDATGLPGRYDFDLRIFPGSVAQSPNDALREQLGLWLEERSGPGDVLVIDTVQRPILD